MILPVAGRFGRLPDSSPSKPSSLASVIFLSHKGLVGRFGQFGRFTATSPGENTVKEKPYASNCPNRPNCPVDANRGDLVADPFQSGILIAPYSRARLADYLTLAGQFGVIWRPPDRTSGAVETN